MIALAKELQEAVNFYNERADEEYILCYYHLIDCLNDASDEVEVQDLIDTIYEAIEEPFYS